MCPNRVQTGATPALPERAVLAFCLVSARFLTHASVAELADALGLGPSGPTGCGGSSPPARTLLTCANASKRRASSPLRWSRGHEWTRNLLSLAEDGGGQYRCDLGLAVRKHVAVGVQGDPDAGVTEALADDNFHLGPAGRVGAHDTAAARHRCPSLNSKRVTAHTLRHTAAMRLLAARVDITVIALWLGHEQIATTNLYLHADMNKKERAIARVTPPTTKPGRYQPPDTLLAFLEAL
jgi:hypothetical protein